MTPNNNISVLPFYTELAKQNHRKDYALGEIFCLHTPEYILPPFQIIRDYDFSSITAVNIINLDTGVSTNITSQVVAGGLSVYPDPGHEFSIVKYPYGTNITGLTKGRYYLTVTLSTPETWYSDVFVFIDNVEDHLKIQWYDLETLEFTGGAVDYSDAFRWVLHLPTQLGRPLYEFEEESTIRNGQTFVEKQISYKKYEFTFLAPEYLLDAMRIIRLCDAVFIRNKGESYYVDRFLMTPKWEDGGFIASVEAEFECDTVIKKIGKVFTTSEIGDFNDDFNNDFN